MDHFVKGRLTNGLLLPMMANVLQKSSDYGPQMLLELAAFAAEAGQRTNSGSEVNLKSVRFAASVRRYTSGRDET